MEETRKSNGKFYTFLIISILLAGVLGYFIYQNKQLDQTNEEQSKEIVAAYNKLDSISSELEQRINTISDLGGEIDSLLLVKNQVEKEKKQILARNKNYRNTIAKLNEKVDGYTTLLKQKDDEIRNLLETNILLSQENNTLKVEKQNLNQNIRSLETEKSELAKKIDLASKLQVANIATIAIAKNGKERTKDFKKRHVSKLKIQFDVLENKVAPIKQHEILVRVLATDGNVLFDIEKGSGSFSFEGRELFYSFKESFLYDRRTRPTTTVYVRDGDYESGQYSVEFYTDGYLLGQSNFTVK